MATDRLELLIGVLIDRIEGLANIERLQSGIEDVNQELNQVDSAANNAGDAIGRSFIRANEDVQKTRRSVKDLYEDFERGRTRLNANVGVFGDVGTDVRTLTGAAAASGLISPETEKQLNLVAEGFESIESSARLAASSLQIAQTALAVLGGPLVIGLIAATAAGGFALSEYVGDIEDFTGNVTRQAQALKSADDILSQLPTLTAADLSAYRDSLENEIAARRRIALESARVQEDYNKQLEAVGNSALIPLGNAIDDFANSVFGVNTPLDASREINERLATVYSDLNIEADRLADVQNLLTDEYIAQAAAAEKILTTLEARTRVELELLDALEQGPDAVAQTLADLEAEINVRSRNSLQAVNELFASIEATANTDLSTSTLRDVQREYLNGTLDLTQAQSQALQGLIEYEAQTANLIDLFDIYADSANAIAENQTFFIDVNQTAVQVNEALTESYIETNTAAQALTNTTNQLSGVFGDIINSVGGVLSTVSNEVASQVSYAANIASEVNRINQARAVGDIDRQIAALETTIAINDVESQATADRLAIIQEARQSEQALALERQQDIVSAEKTLNRSLRDVNTQLNDAVTDIGTQLERSLFDAFLDNDTLAAVQAIEQSNNAVDDAQTQARRNRRDQLQQYNDELSDQRAYYADRLQAIQSGQRDELAAIDASTNEKLQAIARGNNALLSADERRLIDLQQLRAKYADEEYRLTSLRLANLNAVLTAQSLTSPRPVTVPTPANQRQAVGSNGQITFNPTIITGEVATPAQLQGLATSVKSTFEDFTSAVSGMFRIP